MSTGLFPFSQRGRRLILFGAFDRHNLGDLLLAHCAAFQAQAPQPLFAGLVSRDLRAFGGHAVTALDELIAMHADAPADLVHVGGELLTTSAWEAAVMLQTPAAAMQAITRNDRSEDMRRHWAREVLGTARQLPYIVPACTLPRDWRTHFRAIGGVAIGEMPEELRTEAIQALSEATSLSVRDRNTLAQLHHYGIDTALEQDPVEALDLAAHFPAHGPPRSDYIAAQIAADWGDDTTLDRIAEILCMAARSRGAGITLFRAGLAPWHDDLPTLERLARRISPHARTTVFASGHIADLCTLLMGARAFVGTSLHAWIVANRAEVPALCLVRNRHDKAAAYLDTWHATPRRWRTLDECPIQP